MCSRLSQLPVVVLLRVHRWSSPTVGFCVYGKRQHSSGSVLDFFDVALYWVVSRYSITVGILLLIVIQALNTTRLGVYADTFIIRICFVCDVVVGTHIVHEWGFTKQDKLSSHHAFAYYILHPKYNCKMFSYGRLIGLISKTSWSTMYFVGKEDIWYWSSMTRRTGYCSI
jgi:hypothetical protein